MNFMLSMNYDQMKEKILAEASLSEDDFEKQVKAKLDKLSGLISKEGAAHILANELGVKLVEVGGPLKIKNILNGMRNVEVVGRVVAKYEVRTFQKETRSGKVGNFLLGDDTGVIRIVLWNDQTDLMEKFNKGDVVKLSGALVRQNQDRQELHINDSSTIEINPEGVTVPGVQEKKEAARKSIGEITERDYSVDVLATIVQVYDPAFFPICTECKRKPQQVGDVFTCQTHGTVVPDYGYVLNAFLDDGSGNMRGVFFREQALALTGLDHQAFLAFKENKQEFEDIKTELLGTIVSIEGNVKKNATFDRIELIANKVKRDPSPEKELEKEGVSVKTDSEEEAEPVEKKEPEKQELPKPEELEDEIVSLDDLDDLTEETI